MRATRSSKIATQRNMFRATFLLFLGIFCIADELPAQRTVMVYQEPRHRVVVDEGDIKLLDVQIIPGDTTLNHTHDSPILYTYINLGHGSTNGRVVANLQYADEPFTHSVSHSGTELFRIIALANYGEGKQDDSDEPAGLPSEPNVENRWYRSYRFDLEPGQTTPIHTHQNPVVVVQVSDGRVEVSKDSGFGAELTGQGHWTWRDPGSSYRIKNAGVAPVSVVVNEAR